MDVDPEVQSLIDTLSASEDARRQAQGLELGALSAIYPSVRVHRAPASRPGTPAPASSASSGGDRTRFVVTLQLEAEAEDGSAPEIDVLVSLPEEYPECAPTLQLLGKYVGAYAVDAGLFGSVTRTYLTAAGVPFSPGQECIFDGLVHVQALVEAWYAAHVAVDAAGEAARASASASASAGAGATPRASPPPPPTRLASEPKPGPPGAGAADAGADAGAAAAVTTSFSKLNVSASAASPAPRPLPAIFSSAPIVDRKSSFVGHCARIGAEGDVAAVVAHLLEDRRIARAAHPAIWAYRLSRHTGGPAGTVTEGDYDDDGETQAGSRLKHLLEILDVRDTVVVVSRWFGGVHLGPDRFKHINQAARDAMELAGVLDEPPKKDRRRR